MYLGGPRHPLVDIFYRRARRKARARVTEKWQGTQVEKEARWQRTADKKWADKNREGRRYLSYRSSSGTLIRSWANLEDLEELKGLILARKEELLKN